MQSIHRYREREHTHILGQQKFLHVENPECCILLAFDCSFVSPKCVCVCLCVRGAVAKNAPILWFQLCPLYVDQEMDMLGGFASLKCEETNTIIHTT